jgi:CheY-like chemotaxis protein
MRVLVVDDEPDARELAQRILEERGARVLPVASARQALEALAAESPDVIVSDVGMPGMDGYSLLRAIRAGAAAHGRDVPAVAVTAFARPADAENARAAGFQVHLAKPLDPGEIVATVARLGRRARDVAEAVE